MRTANYSELRNNLKHYLDGVINDSEPLLVHRPGNESVFPLIRFCHCLKTLPNIHTPA